jgi:hypothetical protein
MNSEKDYWAMFAAAGITAGWTERASAETADSMVCSMAERYGPLDDKSEDVAALQEEVARLRLALFKYGMADAMEEAPPELQNTIQRAIDISRKKLGYE